MNEPFNLLSSVPEAGIEEDFLTLLLRPGLRVERIVSDCHASPAGFWYDQPEDEWVLLLQGSARLEYADGRQLGLCPGDSLLIPAHCRHRVAETGLRTVWLAIFHGAPA